ncbi:MAG: adenosylmethionine--8-amino-7-oxononanoate transaminase [Candidatus Omnitrophica bacterium]|nr:adenosylmethionine--8-amino-7-oxononanoate transaminase [Candidatus Omnitrophota bacterium]
MKRTFFITGTDTGVGKTYAMLALGALLQASGHDVGVFKPVQSGVGDAEFLKKNLKVADGLREINPYFAKEALAPHLAFARAGVRLERATILRAFAVLQERHEAMLIEGAGGLLVPLAHDYFMSDLARDLQAELIIVARLGLGTINHTLLTVRQAQQAGLKVAGIIFVDTSGGKKGLSESDNPKQIRALAGVPILGIVPFLKKTASGYVVRQCCARVDMRPLLKKTASRTKELIAKDKKYVWHPFTQMRDWGVDVPGAPLVIERGDGVYLIDTDGKRYIDGVSSLWVTVHGHRKAGIDQALKAQIDKIAHSTMLGLSNTPAVELAEKLAGIAPDGLSKVFYSDNGSTAAEIAVKMSYQFWQNTGCTKKTTICHLANSYHGDTLGSVSVGGIDLFHKVYRKLIFKTHQVAFPDCYRSPEDAFEAVAVFEQFLKKNHEQVASLILEPIVQGAAGMIMWPKGVLKAFETACRKYDVLLICDEVATGFGRTGTMFACEHENVKPDFLCIAKGLTGGYLPLAATLTTQRIFNGFIFPYQDMKTFFHGHTYTGNPLACAAALANLEIFKKERTIRRLQPKIAYLAKGLKRFWDIPAVGDIRQRGFMAGIELVKDRATKEPFPGAARLGARVCERARAYGVIIRPLGDVLVIMPPLSITKAEIDILLNAVERAIKDYA